MCLTIPARDWRALTMLLSLLGTASLAAQAAPTRPFLELHAWGGYSSFAAAPQSPTQRRAGGTGLRQLEVALWPSRSLRLFGRYDNSLSLDNLSLLRAGTRVPTWSGGGIIQWNQQLTTVLRGGHRTLPGRVGQTLAGVEQIVFLQRGVVLKGGADVGRRADDRTEWVTHLAVNLPATERLRLEPVLFYSRGGVAGESQWRALLSAEQRIGGRSSFGLGVAGGQVRGSGRDGTVWDSYARVSASLGARSHAHAMVRHERAPNTSALTSVSLGLSVVVSRP